MAVYIKGTGNISPQHTWNREFLDNIISYQGSRLQCIEPEYSEWMDVKQLRRMSRLMKMGAGAAMLALKNAGTEKPDAIITGTGLGCLEDTGNFLSRLINNQEDALNPTPFIQSTHNTVGSHIALLLQCQGYNQTYSSGSFSFENALLDAMLQLSDFPDQNILVGGVDEITDESHNILNRFGIYKKNNVDSLKIFKNKNKGTLHGEGSSWFVLSSDGGESKNKVEGVATIYKPSENSIDDYLSRFLATHQTAASEIDLILAGKSGDVKSDFELGKVLSSVFQSSSVGVFKHLCGEYPVASSFALWLADSILKTGVAPNVILEKDCKRAIKTILIYNKYFREHHSLILLKAGDQ